MKAGNKVLFITLFSSHLVLSCATQMQLQILYSSEEPQEGIKILSKWH